MSDEQNEKVDPSIVNIAGTSNITRSGRIFSPEISPPAQITVSKATIGARGKDLVIEPARMEAPK